MYKSLFEKFKAFIAERKPSFITVDGRKIDLNSDHQPVTSGTVDMIERLVLEPAAPTDELKELMSRDRTTRKPVDCEIMTVENHEGSQTFNILKGRNTDRFKLKLNFSPTTKYTDKLLEMGVPEEIALKLHLRIMAKHIDSKETTFGEELDKLINRIRFNKGNWCKEFEGENRVQDGDKIWHDRLEGYFQLAVYEYWLFGGMESHQAFKGMKEIEDQIAFFANTMEQHIRMLSGHPTRNYFIYYSTLRWFVADELIPTGVAKPHNRLFKYDECTKYNIS